MYLAKQQSEDYINCAYVEDSNLKLQNSYLSDGFSEVIITNVKPPKKNEYSIVDIIVEYDSTLNAFIGKFVNVLDIEKCKKEISIIKQQLANTDYKVVKNMEYQMAMMATSENNQIILDLYDPQELHNERQALRDKINELEQLLKGE